MLRMTLQFSRELETLVRPNSQKVRHKPPNSLENWKVYSLYASTHQPIYAHFGLSKHPICTRIWYKKPVFMSNECRIMSNECRMNVGWTIVGKNINALISDKYKGYYVECHLFLWFHVLLSSKFVGLCPAGRAWPLTGWFCARFFLLMKCLFIAHGVSK